MRNHSRRHTLAYASLSFFCLFAFSLLLSACSQASSSDGKIHLTLWYWNRSIDDGLLNSVSKQFPNIVLTPEKITDYDNKVRTTLAGHSGIPDIIGINANISTYFPDEDQFVDMRSLGADDLKSQYLDWKWNLGVTSSGRMIGFPMDTGPTALFYREDIFKQAGLPTDPTAVSNTIKTWDDYLQAAAKLKSATNGKSFMIDSNNSVFNQIVAQSAKQFFEPNGRFIGDQSHIKQAWDESVKASETGVTAQVPLWSAGWNQSVSTGLIASFVGAVWMKQIVHDAAPDTTGKWRVANAPGGAGNSGGSFLAIPSASAHPKEAFEVIKWLQSPQNQLTGYKDLQLFPSATSALSDPSLQQPEPFFGGQNTTPIFTQSAQSVPLSYSGPDDGTVWTALTDQLSLVEQQHKNPNQAWTDGQQRGQRELLR